MSLNHFTTIKENIKNSHLEFLIHIKLYPPAFEKLKAKPGYTSMVRDEKQKICFATSTALNNYPFDGKRGAFSDDRMVIQFDEDELKSEDIPYINIYVTGVRIDEDVVKEVFRKLHRYRPHLVGKVEFKDLFKEKLSPGVQKTFGELIDEL